MVGYHKPWNIIQLWTVLYVVMWSYGPMWSDIDQRFKTWYWPGLRVRYHFCVLGRYLFIWVHKSTYWPYNHSQHMILLITLLSVLKQKILHTEKKRNLLWSHLFLDYTLSEQIVAYQSQFFKHWIIFKESLIAAAASAYKLCLTYENLYAHSAAVMRLYHSKSNVSMLILTFLTSCSVCKCD